MTPGLMAWAAAVAITNAGSTTATNEEVSILRPPLPPVPPGFWESQGAWGIAGTVAVVLGVMTLAGWWWWRARQRKVEEDRPVIERARARLQQLAREPESGEVLSAVSRVVRVYFVREFGLTRGELTTSEFSQALRDSGKVTPAMAATAEDFLKRCDARKFGPAPPDAPLGAAETAIRIITEAQREKPGAVKADTGGKAESAKGRGI
jgi:hypothetical protein